MVPRFSDRTFSHSGHHRHIYPPVLTDRNGDLAYSCFEVCRLLPDSPAHSVCIAPK